MDSIEIKKEAIRYWERRRIVWNVLIVIPAIYAWYIVVSDILRGDAFPKQRIPEILGAFIGAGFLANICYSFAYAAEFCFSHTALSDVYRETVRPVLFLFGCLIGIALAVFCGMVIAGEILAPAVPI